MDSIAENVLKTYAKLNTEQLLHFVQKIEESGKTFAIMPPRPGSGIALNDDDEYSLLQKSKKVTNEMQLHSSSVFPKCGNTRKHFWQNLVKVDYRYLNINQLVV